MRVEIDAGADSLDPGLSYTSESWQSLWNVYLSPLGYQHVNGRASTQIVPALAESMPNISDGGRVYEFRLRKGLRYSNGTRVLAGDFGYAIRRLYLLDSLGAPLFDDVVGASGAAARRGPISGIESDDSTRTITIHLKRPSADFADALASLFAAPVPQSTPSHDQTREPIPSTGPYKITQVRWPRDFTLVRNRFFEPSETVPRTNPDRIIVSVAKDSRTAFEQLVAGEADYTGVPIALAALERAEQKGFVKLRIHPGANTYYFFMNARVWPFNSVRVRRAVNFALDREKLVKIFGGPATPTENILPPVYPSYKKHDLYPYDLAKARALIRRAKATGAKVTIYGLSRPATARALVFYLKRQLTAIGLRPRSTPRLLSPELYWTTVGSRRTRAQIGYAFWIQSYPQPLEWFGPLLSGDQTGGLANTNYSFANVASFNAEIERLSREPELTDSVNEQWATLDSNVMRWAPVAPFLNQDFVDAFGPRVDLRCYVSNVLYGLDYGRLCLG
ncbi:MAG: ABC transporter substrate-binding protein [Gaiellaceae bacterium]